MDDFVNYDAADPDSTAYAHNFEAADPSEVADQESSTPFICECGKSFPRKCDLT